MRTLQRGIARNPGMSRQLKSWAHPQGYEDGSGGIKRELPRAPGSSGGLWRAVEGCGGLWRAVEG
eukprot:9309290-Alexandrium_andersonii.AAC.1